ncbi:lipoxygenase family protein [Sandaracinus amylolyticus]|uniref:lipoxygenase family protein n=1 Tax=Sandaracinus amylolyticus TaxID=927083 RepID=UPI001F1DF82B|nr:lipoxygenase family protein [Sandaracinus amylolyticus]UJR78343.1 Lipoxygenase [Sandaracinus amylolyticus]
MSDFVKLVRELVAFEALGHAPLDALLKLRDRLRGNGDRTHTVRGRIVHPGGKPIRGLVVELWDDHVVRGDDFLGETETQEDGRFEIAYAPMDDTSIVLRLYEPPQVFSSGGQRRERRVQIERIRGPRQSRQIDVDLGDHELAYYEYESKIAFPYTSRESIRRDFVPGAADRFFSSLAKWGVIHDEIVLGLRLGAKPTTAHIQSKYPKTRTLVLEEKERGSTRSDAYFGDRILNGFFPARFKRKPGDQSGLHLAFTWSKLELNGLIDLPDMAARFELKSGHLVPTEIRLAFRAPDGLSPPGKYAKETTYTAADGARWAEAKRVFRTLYFGVYGQLYGHVALAHFNMEQYAIAMNRNLRKSPLRSILMPHLKEVSNINDKGRTLLLGADDGLFALAKPITLPSQLKWLESNVGRHDWHGFSPRTPLSAHHVYAQAAQLYWEAIHEYLRVVFAERRAELESTWSEVLDFERDLLEHSVALTERGMEEAGDELAWDDRNELAVAHPGRAKRADGRAAAITPITGGRPFGDEALANLQQLCAYCIFHTTFVHGWFHQEQNNEFGEIEYAQMLTGGSMKPEGDPSILPDAELQSLGLRVTHSLTGFDWGFLTKNEDGDLDPRLIEAVRSRADRFSAIGFDISTLRSRLNS